jgi:hypothetical protein
MPPITLAANSYDRHSPLREEPSDSPTLAFEMLEVWLAVLAKGNPGARLQCVVEVDHLGDLANRPESTRHR